MISSETFSKLAIECSGLKPKAWVIVGAGAVREDFKTEILSRGAALTGHAVMNQAQLLALLCGVSESRVLPPSARVERLRALLSSPTFSTYFEELKRNKRQSGFFRKLDRALQAYRMVAAHSSERLVMDELAIARVGQNPNRKEIAHLDLGWRNGLEGEDWWDQPRLLEQACQIFEESRVSVRLPNRVYRIGAQIDEGLEAAFWDAISRTTEVVSLFDPSRYLTPSDECRLLAKKAHTIDEASDEVASQLRSILQDEGEKSLHDTAVLIPDDPVVRRSLLRSLRSVALEFTDPRDPVFLRSSEELKRALLPLELVAQGFPRERVSAFVRDPTLRSRLEDAAIVQGLERYRRPGLESVYEALKEVDERFGARLSAAEFKRRHLEYLERFGFRDERVQIFLSSAWDQLELDISMSGRVRRAAPCAFWLERLKEKVQSTTPPAVNLRPSFGAEVFRVSQLPPREFERVIFLNVPGNQFDPKKVGDYAWTDREREVLSQDIQTLRSPRRDAELRLAIARSWVESAKRIEVVDALYGAMGGEHSGSEAWAKEVFGRVPQEWGVAQVKTSRLQSWGPPLEAPPVEVRLAPYPTNQAVHLKASSLDNYAKCGFLGFARNHLKAENLERASTDMRRRSRGIVLHRAADLAVRKIQDNQPLDCGLLIDQVWEEEKHHGLVRSPAIEAYHKRSLTRLLQVFVESELQFRQDRSIRTIIFDNEKVTLEFEGVSIEGRPDRVDEHGDGLLLWDYKSSSTAPSTGLKMVDEGEAVQLLVYASALRKKYQKEVVAAGYIQLSSEGKRTSGVFFKAHNRKGGPTSYRANTKGLLDESPADVWARAEQTVRREVERLMRGEFDAKPKDPKSCLRCEFKVACGDLRRMPSEEGEVDEG